MIQIGINKSTFHILDTTMEGFCLPTRVRRISKVELVSIMYGPNDNERIHTFQIEICDIHNQGDTPWIIDGNINVIRFVDEHLGGDYNSLDREAINDLIWQLGIISIPITNGVTYGPT